MKTARSICILLLLLVPTVLHANAGDRTCSNHCGSSHIPAGIMLGHVHEKKQWMISYRYMHMEMKGLVKGNQAITHENVFASYLMSPNNMRMNMHMLMVMYGVSNRFTVMGMGSYNFTAMDMSMFAASAHHHSGSPGHAHEHSMKTKGIGDTKIHALYAPVKTGFKQLIVSLGLNLPTGSIGIKGISDDIFYAGQRLPYDMQQGSGTFDFLPGITFVTSKHNAGFGIQATGIVRTGQNNAGYRWGNDLNINTWLTWQWWEMLGLSARMEGIASGSITGSDRTLYRYTEPAANANNHGGRKINAYAGVFFRAKKGFLSKHSLSAEYGLPVYQNLYGIQMPAKQMLNAAWSLTF